MLWRYAHGNVLEVGVGTGKNFPYYPPNVTVTGIDLADQMLPGRVPEPKQLRMPVELWEGDARLLDFPDNSFDTAGGHVCLLSVPDPVRGLAN